MRRLGTDYFGRPWRRLPCPYPLSPDPRALRELTTFCEGRTALLGRRQTERHRPVLLALSAHRRDWVRSLDAWHPPEEGAEVQCASLLRHLLAVYEVPRFLDAARWEGLTPDGVTRQAWYSHIGRGRNIRTAKGLPIPLTRRMAHHFVRAPDDCGIPAAFRYAQVLSLGGDERLARSLLATRIGAHFLDDPFWTSVIRWLLAHPSLAPDHHGPVIDYLYARKYVPTLNRESRRRGQPRQPLLIPPRSNLSMNGRTPDTLLRDVERWHRVRGSGVTPNFTEWQPSGIAPLVHEAGEGADRKVYETTELICIEELREEGAAMCHCVASYWQPCATGGSSIWSLTVEDASGRVKRLLTVGVRDGERIVQARGKANRLPTADELDILARWGEVGGPSLPEAHRLTPVDPTLGH